MNLFGAGGNRSRALSPGRRDGYPQHHGRATYIVLAYACNPAIFIVYACNLELHGMTGAVFICGGGTSTKRKMK